MTADPTQYKTLLKSLVPLNALSDEQLGQLVGHITFAAAKDGEFLFREGDNDRRHIFVLQGQVKLLTGAREAGIVKGGTQNARFALSHQLPRKFSGQAVGDVRFAHLDSDLLHDLVVHNTTAQAPEVKPDDAADWMSLVIQARVVQMIPPASIQSVLRRMERVSFKKGDVVIKQGDEADYFYVIVFGTGIVTREDPGGNRQLAVLSQGDAFGEDALVSGANRAATVSMASDGVLARLSKEDFSTLIRRPLVEEIRMSKARPLIKQGAIWLDIRHAEEYAKYHMEGAINLPLENIRERYHTYSTKDKYVVYGPPGNSAAGTFILRERGFNVVMLADWVPDEESGLGVTSVDGNVGGSNRVPGDSSLSGLSGLVPEIPPEKQDQKKYLEQQFELYKKRLKLKALEAIQLLKNQLAETQNQLDATTNQLDKAKIENQRLEQALKQARESKASAGDMAAPLQQRIDELESEMAKMRAELEETQELVNDSTDIESKLTWENTRILARLERAERDLGEQYELNNILREENEEMAQRIRDIKT